MFSFRVPNESRSGLSVEAVRDDWIKVGNSVFHAQSTSTVMSGRVDKGNHYQQFLFQFQSMAII